jgi:hypothetical protein
MPRSIKTPLKPTKFEDLDPRTQKFLEERGSKKEFVSGGKKSAPLPPSKKPSEKFSKGGRAGFKSGSKGCKLAMKGKGRAYGKN